MADPCDSDQKYTYLREVLFALKLEFEKYILKYLTKIIGYYWSLKYFKSQVLVNSIK